MYYTKFGKKVYAPLAYARTGAPMYDKDGNNVNKLKSIYLVHLEKGKKYIGQSGDFLRRCDQHLSGEGSCVTRKYRPYKVEILEHGVPGFVAHDVEQEYTEEFIKVFGYSRVRGGRYTNSRNF